MLQSAACAGMRHAAARRVGAKEAGATPSREIAGVARTLAVGGAMPVGNPSCTIDDDDVMVIAE